jgi:DNA-binding CsgD family transcriptional regulator
MPASTALPPLLERDAELTELTELIDQAQEGLGRITLIEGVAGIGKSRVLEEVCSRAEEAGMRVLRARGGELERDLGWRVMRELFGPIVDGAEAGERASLFSGAAGLAEPVLVEAADRSMPTGPDALAAALQGLYWLTANIATEGPVLLAVDDAQWADIPSIRFLAHLAARIEQLPLLLALTARPVEPGPEGERLSALTESALLAVIAGLARVVKLAPLSESAGAALVERELGATADPGFATACHAATGGNPFLLGELLGALARDSVAPTSENAGQVHEIEPETVARAVLLRLSRLPAEAGKLADAVAVLGKDVRLRDAAELAGLDEDRAGHAAEALATSDILVDRVPLEFVHPIVRGAVYRELPAATRTQWHERAARQLSQAGAPDVDVAVHLLHVEPGADERATKALARAAEHSIASGAPDAAIPLLRRALEEPPTDSDRAGLLHLLGLAETLIGGPRGIETLLEAFRSSENPRERATIAMEHSRVLGMTYAFRGAVKPLEEVLDELEPGSQLATEVETELIRISVLDLSTLPIALQRIAPFINDPEAVDAPQRILADIALASAGMGAIDANGTAALVKRAIERAGGELDSAKDVYLMTALGVADELEAASAIWDRMKADARRSGSILNYAFACIMHSNIHYRLGAVPAAEADVRAAAEIHAEWGVEDTLVVAFLMDALMERDLAGADAALDAAQVPDRPPEVWGYNSVLLSRGRLRLAQGRAREGIDDLLELGRRLTEWGVLNPAAFLWRSPAAVALAGSGDQARARELVEEDVGRARAFGAPSALGMSLRAAGLVEGGAKGEELLQEAVEVLRDSPARLELARALCDLGAARRRAGRRGDALEPLREGLDLARSCGATLLADFARAELVAAGARPRRDALRGRDALTASELRVAEMAAGGMTNREIAQALFVTQRTIETHLTHTYQKLDISSREELEDALDAVG